MTQAKIQGKFYPLQHEEWLELSKKLTHSEIRVLYHLRTLDPFGEKFKEASTKAISDDLEISQRTVQRAVLQLAELKLIDLEITKFNFRVRSQHATPMSPSDTHVATTTPMSPPRHPCRDHDTHVATATPMSPPESESIDVADSCDSKTNKIYLDLLQTLSEGEREKFENFCKKAIARLPEKPVLTDSWLSKHCQELYRIFKESHEVQSSASSGGNDFQINIESLKRLYPGDGWKQAAAHYGLEVES